MTSKRLQFDPTTGKRLRARAGRPWLKLRQYCQMRDETIDGGLFCYECKCDLTGTAPGAFNVDHILPKSLDFDTLEYEAGNVAILCFTCNNRKDSDRLPADREVQVLTEVARRNALMGKAQTPVATLLAQFPHPGA